MTKSILVLWISKAFYFLSIKIQDAIEDDMLNIKILVEMSSIFFNLFSMFSALFILQLEKNLLLIRNIL